jgi:hypothetical protein
MRNHDRFRDPMRELDLLLDDLTMHRDVEPARTATALRTRCMLLVLLSTAVLPVYALKHSDVDMPATSKPRDASSAVH